MTNETQSLKSALVVSGVTVNARSAWGGGPVTCSSRHTPYRFAVHHTDTPSSDSLSPEARLRQIQAYHRKNNGWCDIGYQFLVSRDGRLWEGRGVSYIGAHVYSQNTGNVAISFLGSYGTTAAPEAMINSAARLFGAMAKTYGVTLSTSTLKGHRFWYNNSSCPGNALAAQIPTIIARAKSGVSSVTLTGKVVTADLLAGPIAGATVQVGDKTAISDATGSFSIPSVAIGSVTVTASAAGYAPQTATVNATLNGATVKLSLTNLTVGVLRGRAYHASNPLLSVPGAKVDVAGKSAVTSEFGDFELPAVPAGTHRLSVSASGFTPYTQDIVVDAGVLDLSFALEPSATLPTGNATLTGVIYRGSNTANRIAGATVTLSDGRTATADAGGVYTFTQLPPATFVITASKVGIGTNSVQRTLANGTTTWGSVSLP